MTSTAPPPNHKHGPLKDTRTVCSCCVASMYTGLRQQELVKPLRKGDSLKACLMFDVGDERPEREHCWVRVRGDPANGEGSLKNMPVLLAMVKRNRAEFRRTVEEVNLPPLGATVQWRDARKTLDMRVITAWRMHPTQPWRPIDTDDE